MTVYNYTQTVNPPKLHKEIAAALASPALIGVDFDGSQVSIEFDGDADLPALDGLLAAHDPAKPLTRRMIAPSTLIRKPQSVENRTEWESMAGVVSKPDFFVADLSSVIAHVLGQFFCVGGGGQIRVVEDRYGMGQFIKPLSEDLEVPDTQGQWQILSFFTHTPPSDNANLYELQARLNTAADLKIRNASLALYQLVA